MASIRDPNDPRRDPIAADPYNPLPLGPEPLSSEPRYADDPRVVNRVDVQAERRTGASVLVAALVVVLALVAYFAFSGGPGTDPGTTATIPPAATETVPAPAPSDDTIGAAPAAPIERAPDAMAPEGGNGPMAPAPATPEPAAPAPAE